MQPRPNSTSNLRNATFIGAVLCVSTTSGASTFTPLGILPNDQQSSAYSVSDDGRVVVGESRGLDGAVKVVRWTDDTGVVGIGLLPGDDRSQISTRSLPAMSADGSVIVGLSYDHDSEADEIEKRPFIYRHGHGLETLPHQRLEDFGITADGDNVVGSLPILGRFRSSVVRSSLSNDQFDVVGTHPPIENQSWWPNGDFTRAYGFSSPNASVILGLGNRIESHPSDGSVYGPRRPFRWTAETGLEHLILDGFVFSSEYGDEYHVSRVSANGAVLAGTGLFENTEVRQAFRWTEDTGAVPLGWLPVDNAGQRVGSTPHDMTEDGSLIVGRSSGTQPVRSFIWSDKFGMEDLQNVLAERFDLAAELDGWSLAAAYDISPNGQFITGTGYNPDGVIEGWLVRLDRPFLAVPEPGLRLLLSPIVALVLSCRDVKRRRAATRYMPRNGTGSRKACCS